MTGLVIYQSADGSEVCVKLEGDTLWLTQEQISILFQRDRSVITKHLRNIFKEGELEIDSVCAKFAHTAADGKTYQVDFYNLDAIISVGYRVNSKRGTQFRQWATRTLKAHLVQGWTLDRARFEKNAAELEAALSLVRKTAKSSELISEVGQGFIEIISRYTQTFLLLQRYDEGLLANPKGTEGGVLPSLQEVKILIANLKANLISRGEASDLFGREREDGLASILGNLEQSVFGEPAYPTIERKAAHLLYFMIKNHPLTDGNKRTGAFLFVDFLNRNHVLIKNGEPVINDVGLAALALLIAESDPAQKETMVRLIENMLAGIEPKS